MTRAFKHSGSFGDLIYGLALVRHMGGGSFRVHLRNQDQICLESYGHLPWGYHKGRLTDQDYEQLEPLLRVQSYITDVRPYDGLEDVHYNLDRFRDLFKLRVNPGNFVDLSARRFGLEPTDQLRNTPWLTVPQPRPIEGKPVVINRSERYNREDANQRYFMLKESIGDQAVFIGFEADYLRFSRQFSWDLPWVPTPTLLDMAEIIAGSEQFIGNQSAALSMAIGLGQTYYCEQSNLSDPKNNECYFANNPRGSYF